MTNTQVRVNDLSKTFQEKKTILGMPNPIRAVDHVSFEIAEGEIVGLVGESGSGKTTTGRILLGVEKPDSGTVEVNGKEIFSLDRAGYKTFRKDVQMIYQDPFSSL